MDIMKLLKDKAYLLYKQLTKSKHREKISKIKVENKTDKKYVNAESCLNTLINSRKNLIKSLMLDNSCESYSDVESIDADVKKIYTFKAGSIQTNGQDSFKKLVKNLYFAGSLGKGFSASEDFLIASGYEPLAVPLSFESYKISSELPTEHYDKIKEFIANNKANSLEDLINNKLLPGYKPGIASISNRTRNGTSKVHEFIIEPSAQMKESFIVKKDWNDSAIEGSPFPLKRMCYSDTAKDRNIPNIPGTETEHDLRVRENLRNLVMNVLVPAREILGVNLHINSGYRSPLLNKAVKGASGSDHCKGRAADVTIGSPAQNLHLLQVFMMLPYKQLIWENHGKWIHVSL